jgi:hypothetical protein
MCEQNAEFVNVKVGGIYSNHSGPKGEDLIFLFEAFLYMVNN